MAIPAWYETLFIRYAPLLQAQKRLYIALSAGVDSNLLLHWLHHYADQLPPITSLHVNHNWHGEYSHIWARFAQNASEAYGFTHQHFDCYFEERDPRGLEAAGREERYKLMSQAMTERPSLLLVAHHRSDQAETLFHRLIRSAGIRGLGAMHDQTTLQFANFSLEILRPFLSISKSEIYRAAEANGIEWLEDYTNHEVDGMVRNIIRNDIFPTIAKHFPHYESAFYQSSQFLQESYALLQEVAAEDFAKLATADTVISHPQFCTLTQPRQKNLLQYWLSRYNITLTQAQIEEFFLSFIERMPTHHAIFPLGDYQIRYFQEKLYLVDSRQAELEPTLTWIQADNAPPRSFWQSRSLTLKLRQPGIRFHPQGRDRSQTVKKLLQAENLPLWERQQIWMVVDQQSEEIYWIEHLGLAQSLSPYCEAKGYLPTLRYHDSQ